MEPEMYLTVAIPVFNGAATIGLALQSVLAQAVPGVEVIVSDNCSEDATPALVAEYLRKHACLKYFRNEKNVGYDRNVDLAMLRAKGRFVWLLGDDDIIMPGGVREILNVIAANPECGVIFANCPHAIKISKGDGGVCRTGDEFFARTRFKSGFVSTNIFNRRLWSEINVAKYLETGWIHIGFLMEALQRSPSYITEYFCVDYIRDAAAPMRWGGGGSFIYTGLKLVRIYSQMGALRYSRKTRRQAYWSVKGGYLRNICLAKAKGFAVDWQLVKEFFTLYKGFVSFWLIDLPLLFVPGIIFRYMFKAYKLLLGIFVFGRCAGRPGHAGQSIA